MRIAFVAQPFDRLDPPVQGGSLAIWIYQVARRCAQRDHETFVFANHGGTSRAKTVQHDGVEYVFTPTGLNGALNRLGEKAVALKKRFTGREGRVPSFAALWRDAGYAIAVARRLRRLHCDAVLVMNYTQLVPIIRRLHPRCKIYLYMQCEWLTQLDFETMAARSAAADRVGGCSEYITRKIAARFPRLAEKCVTLNNAATPAGMDSSRTRQKGDVLFVGRVSPEKGVHLLVDAFHEVLKQFPDARLHLVGGLGSAPLEFLVGLSDDPHVADLRRFYVPTSDGKDPYVAHLERAAGHELGTRIFFAGHVNHDETAAAYRRTSVLVNPSLSESFGMSLVEAMMYGLPVVASRIGGMPYIVEDERTGILVEPADHAALATAICRILADEGLASRLGDTGRRRALDRFTWDRTAETLIEQFEKAASPLRDDVLVPA
jgi:glycosyltransferase involved in cell wall biosynthesis